MPGDVIQPVFVARTCEITALEMVNEPLSLLHHHRPEADHFLAFRGAYLVPVEPVEIVVVAVGVVVATLAAHEFITCNHHGYTHGQHVNRGEVLDLTLAQIVDPLVVRLAFYSTVPAAVVVNAVVVALAIGPVVFFVVGGEVVQREAIMGRDEVDAVCGFVMASLI